MKKCRLFSFTVLLLVQFGMIRTGALATDIVTQKLTGRWIKTPNFYGMGSGGGKGLIAVSERWIAVGAPLASERTSGEGAVQIFNAVTGAWVKELLAPGPPVGNGAFGSSCAFSGNTLVVGQQGFLVGAPGAVHVFSMPAGKVLHSLHPPVADNVADNNFGTAVAISGNRVFVGASRLAARSGAVFVFDLKSGAFLTKIQSNTPTANTYFGGAIAIEGNLLAVGASGVDSNRGAAYLYDLTTLTLIKKIQPAASTAGEFLGIPLAMHHGRLVLSATSGNGTAGKIYVIDLGDGFERVLAASDGAASDFLGSALALDHDVLLATTPNKASQAGAVYVFDLASDSSTEIQKVVSPEVQKYFGSAVAVSGSTAYISAPQDATLGAQAGAVYIMKPILRSMPMAKITAKGDFAPGAAEVTFNRIGDAFMSNTGDYSFVSSLAGPGSNHNRDTGIYGTPSTKPLVKLVAKSRELVSGVLIGSVSKTLLNYPGRNVFMATLTGPGVTKLNDQAICSDDGSNLTIWLRKGDPFGLGGSPIFKAFPQVVQTRAADRIAMAYTTQVGVNGATAAADSGMLILGGGGTSQSREGDFTGVNLDTFGQVAPRVAGFFDRVAYAAAISGSSATNQGVFQMKFQSSNLTVARKGDMATGAAGAKFATFVGESTDAFDMVLFRATLGSPASSSNREGLWSHATNGVTQLVLRKGDSLPALPGVKIAKILRFWQVASQSIILAQLSGVGVSSKNDLALLLYQTILPFNNQVMVLLREGDIAPGCEPATVSTISRVEVEPLTGHYLVLATLRGAPRGTELALFRGFSFRSSALALEETLRRPVVVFRKGQLFSNQPGKVRSLTLPTTNVQPSGAGNVGLGSAFQEPMGSSNAGPIIIAVDFDNGVHQLVSGTP